MKNTYYVYILMNKTNTMLYVGVTSNIERRLYELRFGLTPGYTSKYNITKLVYIEYYFSIKEAIKREKQLKNWRRNWKINLIQNTNPNFKELDFSDPELNSG